MKVIKNVLSDDSIKSFREEMVFKFKQQCWSISSLSWSGELLDGIQGQCVSSMLSEELKLKLINDIKNYIPKCDNYTFQGYVWDKNSGISLHDDHMYKFGATIYMNTNWNINNGGIFLWRPKDSEEFKAIIPEFNTMVVNDSNEPHMVTPVSVYANEIRVTIQIWGSDN
jgi:Rps23 Pro-64 3,4-dihydroxylase Tpa1-like proline 4-hydroxylase